MQQQLVIPLGFTPDGELVTGSLSFSAPPSRALFRRMCQRLDELVRNAELPDEIHEGEATLDG